MGSVPWYAGDIGREKARCLVEAAQHGDYLVRSSNEPGMYTLLVNDHGKACPFSVTEEEDGAFRFGPRSFTKVRVLWN
jgi:hypothetical protein